MGEQLSPEPDARQADERGPLFDRILADRYSTWRVAPGYQTPQPSEGPHGELVQIFLNDTAADARRDGASQWPDGSIIVKDIYVDHSIAEVAAMEKRGDTWYWGEWTADGEVVAEGGGIEPCQSCHAEGTDYTIGVSIGR